MKGLEKGANGGTGQNSDAVWSSLLLVVGHAVLSWAERVHCCALGPQW